MRSKHHVLVDIMATCTIGNIDIDVDATLLLLSDITGFSVGSTISIENGGGSGIPLITTITALAGNNATIANPATVDVTGEQVCVTGSGVNTGWFGPDGPCECGCTCTCDEARDDYSHTSIALSGVAGASGPYDSANDNQENCFGASEAVSTWSFGGHSSPSAAIATDSCYTEVISQVAVTQTLDDAHWGGTLNGSCRMSDAIAGRVGSFGIGLQQYVTLSGGITYRCVDAAYSYSLLLFAAYLVVNPAFDTAGHPTWTWVTGTGSIVGTKTIGSVDHRFELSRQTSADSFFEVWSVSLVAYAVDPATAISLAAAPYDPFGFLVGTLTLTV